MYEDYMVYLAFTRQGLQEILDAPEAAGTDVWCSADAISQEEFNQLNRINVTRFIYPLKNADDAAMKYALSTIEEHHPGERLWVERILSDI